MMPLCSHHIKKKINKLTPNSLVYFTFLLSTHSNLSILALKTLTYKLSGCYLIYFTLFNRTNKRNRKMCHNQQGWNCQIFKQKKNRKMWITFLLIQQLKVQKFISFNKLETCGNVLSLQFRKMILVCKYLSLLASTLIGSEYFSIMKTWHI